MTEHLQMKKGKSSYARCAELVRAELKEKYPDLKFSVKSHCFAGGDAIDVTLWVDKDNALATEACREELYALVGSIRKPLDAKYVYGHFDAMTDYFDNDNWDPSIPQVKYLHVQPRLKA